MNCRFVLVWGTLLGLMANTAFAVDPILQWNSTYRAVVQGNSTQANPGWSTRSMAILNGSLYDINQAFTPTHSQYLYQGSAPGGASQDAALAEAARVALLDCYPDQAALITADYNTRMATINANNSPAAVAAGTAFGAQVAQSYINWRTNDGASVNVPYTPTNLPGRWSSDPTRPGTQEAWGPGWGAVKTFTLNSSTQFTVPGVPPLNSQAYTDSYNEVKAKGAATGSTRTADETDIGIFWGYDRQGMGPPPVLYNANLDDIATQQNNTLGQNARLFALASVAMADAAIAAWDVKFVDDFWRPITGIREGDNDGNPNTAGDPNWVPLGAPGSTDPMNNQAANFTPPFPAYVSGHATMGAATYEVLRQFYGTDTMNYTLYSAESMPSGLHTRNYTSFSQAEYENAYSRIYLGIHWSFDAIDGISLGNDVADHVYNNFRPIPEPSTWVLLGLAGAGTIAWRLRRKVLGGR
ncbi:MAG: phosphatase PAP2 family protein [Pirellulales bacterium]|nr:phosphatase PAP2 family protein [Pirellulales bacterium]